MPLARMKRIAIAGLAPIVEMMDQIIAACEEQ
jgi:hypothetical protein